MELGRRGLEGWEPDAGCTVTYVPVRDLVPIVRYCWGVGTAIYARISLDHADGAGVARQEADCRALAAREGLTVTAAYVDNSVSAFSGARRPAFEQLIADVQHGDVDTVVVWATDRLYRRLTDLERLVDVFASVPVLAVKSGRVDLATADGRMHARMLGTVAQHASEKTSERVTAAARHRALTGIATTGVRPFGWRRTADGLEPDPVEAPALAEAYRKFLDGANLSQIARWLTGEGFRGSRGGAITQARVSMILRAPRNGGLVAYRGELVDVANAEGRIVSEDTWRQAQRVLAEPGRKTKGRPTNTPLSGLLTCFKCGGVVRPSSNQVRTGQRYKTYACAHNHVSWKRGELESRVLPLIEEWLASGGGMVADLGGGGSGDRGQVDRLRADREALADALARGDLSVPAYAAAVAQVEARLREAEESLVPGVPSAAARLLSGDDIVARFRAAPAGVQREVIAVAVERVVVGQARTRGLEVVWRS